MSEPFLTTGRRQRLADIMQDVGQVALASIAIPFLLEGYRLSVAAFGFGLAIAFWYIALVLSEYEHTN